MKIDKATKLAFFLSLIIILVFSLVFFLFEKQFNNNYVLGAVLFGLAFIILKIGLAFFVKNQSKTIHNLLNETAITETETNSLSGVEKDFLNSQKEQQLNIDELERQNNYRKEFIVNISHELKTPLFSIQGYVETLIDGGIYDENINMAYLKKASNNIDRLSAIVNDVDTIASVERNALNLDKSVFNITELIKDSIDSLELLADKNDISVSLELDTKAYKVQADKEKISRVLVNLISNSIKYGKENGKTIIKLKKISNKLFVSVIDNGIGIKEEQVSRVFERFYRVDSNRSREQGGSGLGLAIVKHIIEAHQEKITVKSIFGEGTTFSFTLTLA